jgi:hypothetical protein
MGELMIDISSIFLYSFYNPTSAISPFINKLTIPHTDNYNPPQHKHYERRLPLFHETIDREKDA